METRPPRRSGFRPRPLTLALGGLLVIPMAVPVLIFGAGAGMVAMRRTWVRTQRLHAHACTYLPICTSF